MEMELKQEEEEVALVATQVNTSPNSRTNVEPTTDDASLDQTIIDMEEGRRPAKALDDAKPKDSRKLKMKRKSLFLVLLTVALADHRQREGTDRSAAAADAMAGEKKRNFAHVVIFALCFGGTVVGYAGYAAWVAWRAAAGEYAAAGDGEVPELVRDLVAPMLGAELFAVIAAVAWLRGRPIDLYAVVFGGELYYGLVVVLVPLCSGALGGDVAAMVITWLAVLPFTGLLGCCLCVHDAFKRIVSEQQRRGAAELKPNLMNKESSNKWDEVLEELAERKE